VLARDVPGVTEGQKIWLAIRPEKMRLTKKQPDSANAVAGTVKDLAYFGKDSLYRIALPGALVQAHAVNSRRGDEGTRVADWDEDIWLSFDPSAAIVLVE
jgi:putrescine transport system ATP-binding protein